MINKICIVGGGTSGFFTAAILSKYSKNNNLDLDIECVYSSKIGTIGVGESTQLHVNDAFKFLELKDKDWMAKCNATYKTNIGFESWSEMGKKFFYPFGDMGNNNNIFFELRSLFPDEVKEDQFSRYALFHSRLAEFNRLTDEEWDFDGLTAYHFDSHLLSKVLFEYCENNGVRFFDDEYISAYQNKSGIEYIVCKESGNHYADLFVDCTGFKSLLLEKELGVSFKSYSDTLVNHKAIVCKIPYTDKNNQLKSYTNNVTMKNGWCWEIPLWDGLSLGYVHSLKFAKKNEIQKEFEDFILDRHSVNAENIRHIDFKTGRREKGWYKNVVAIGLSYSFIEPLEATGIMLMLNNIYRLVEILSTQKVINSFDKQLFNYSVNFETDRQRGFIEMHYATAHRCDTEYWNYVINEVDYDWESLNLKLCLDMTIKDRNYSDSFYGGLPYILAGNGYGPYNPGFSKYEKWKEDVKDQWIRLDEELNSKVEELSTTFEFLKEKIYNNLK